MPETDVAKAVVAWLQGLRWTVYQEVQVSSYGRTADIVAVNHHALWVVESKLCLSIDVIEQALRWAGNAHYISVAVPAGTRRSSQLFSGNLIHAVLEWQRVGLLLVNQDEVTETVHPLIRRRINPHPLGNYILDSLA